MPTYEYVCNECEHQFEYFQSMNDNVLKDCPECKKSELKRLIGSGAGIIFKGSGFYCTDYRSDSYNSAKKQENSAKSSSNKSSKKTTDKKQKTPATA
jgi:putative FmdB family regulatory protein